MGDDEQQTIGEGGELSAGPESDDRVPDEDDAVDATDQAIPEDASDAMHGRG